MQGPVEVKKIILLISVLLYLSSCASVPPVVQPPERDYVIASWYGPKFHGRPTASGEVFNMYAMTCAHKQFPFGTRLRVTNPSNNKSVIVTVNDRGPFVPGRDLDLSYAAAKKIGLIEKGVARVKIEYLGRDMRYVKRIKYSPLLSQGPFTIQVGSFKEKSNAQRLKQGLKLNYRDVYITRAFVKGQVFYRVRVGTFKDRRSAFSFAETLAEEGYSIFITTKD
jgi:rare lipoprotein A